MLMWRCDEGPRRQPFAPQVAPGLTDPELIERIAVSGELRQGPCGVPVLSLPEQGPKPEVEELVVATQLFVRSLAGEEDLNAARPSYFH